MGANYSWWDIGANCDLADHSILLTYDQPGVRRIVQKQLLDMRANGLDTIRHMLWYSRDSEESWGQVKIARGTLSPQHQQNFRDFLEDVKAAGFAHLSVSFAPKGALGPQFEIYDPEYFEENWTFIRHIRGLVKDSGIADARFDLLNEGCPNIYSRAGSTVYDANLKAYIARLYSKYVDTFGNGDVTVSCVSEDGNALPALIAILQSTGRPLPTLFEAHAYMWWYPALSDGILAGLSRFDRTLRRHGLQQPLAFSETYYNNADVADGVARYTASTKRPLTEVTAWPISSTSACIDVPPPYNGDAYMDLR